MEEGVEILPLEGIEIGHVSGNQIKLVREYELPNVKAFQKWGEQSM